MKNVATAPQEAAEDIFFGQSVINWARWFLIAGGMILVLWGAESIGQLVIGTIPVVAMMGMNFYLHGRQLAERPANPVLITLSSLLDVSVITLVVLFWPDPGQRGLASPFFVMYYPAVLAFAFVMRPRIAAVYTLITMAAYGGACLLASPHIGAVVSGSEGGFNLETLVTRLLTLSAVGILGTYYWRIQRDRRRAAMAAPAGTQHGKVS